MILFYILFGFSGKVQRTRRNQTKNRIKYVTKENFRLKKCSMPREDILFDVCWVGFILHVLPIAAVPMFCTTCVTAYYTFGLIYLFLVPVTMSPFNHTICFSAFIDFKM